MKLLIILTSFLTLNLFADDLRTSQWNSEFHSNAFGTDTKARITFTQGTGSYKMNSGNGALNGVTYKELGTKVHIRGNWSANGQSGAFLFIVDTLADSFTGEWTSTGGDSGFWVGKLISKSPNPGGTVFKTPTKGPRDPDAFVVRHGNAVLKALFPFDEKCVTQLFTAGPAKIGSPKYHFVINQKKNGISKTIDTEADSSLLPHEAAAEVIPRLKAAGSPCAFLTKAQVDKNSQINTEKAVDAATKNLKDLETAANDPAFKGKLNGPSIVVSKNEVVLVDPMDAKSQKELLIQSQRGVQEKKTINGPETLQERDQTFGLKDLIEFNIHSKVLRPVSSLNFFAQFEMSMLFVKRPSKILSAVVNNNASAETKSIRMTAEIKVMTPQGYKVVKSIDEDKQTTWERPEQIFMDNAVFFKYPAACVLTPIGPACIEGSLVGSAGIRPYGVTVNPTNFRDFQAYVRPFAHVDIDVFGGLEYGIAHAGIRGQVAILSGTLALLAGNVSDETTDPCVRAEIDKLTYLDGRIFADIQSSAFSGADLDNFAEGVQEYCEAAKAAGAQMVDWGKNVQDGLIDAKEAVGDTFSDAADKVKNVGEDVEDEVNDRVAEVTSPVSKAIGGGFSSSGPLVGLSLGSKKFNNAVGDLKQMKCSEVGQRVKQAAALRYIKEIYHWEGIVLKKHHKWYEACTKVGE